MKRSIVFLFALLLSVATACSGSDDTTQPSPEAASEAPETTGSPVGDLTALTPPPVGGMTTFMDTNNNFEIDHPKNWPLQQQADGCPTTYCFTAPEQDGQIPAAIMVTVGQTEAENLQTGWNTARQLFIGSTGLQPKTVPGTQGNTEMAGENAKTAQYTMDWGLIPAQAEQTMTLNEDSIPFMVTTISGADIWTDLEPTFEEVVTSFAFM